MSALTSFRGLWVETIPLVAADVAAEAERRQSIARFLSKAPGEPRAVYDRFIALTPFADTVSYEEISEGELHGWWCWPQVARPGCAILYLHGGTYIRGSARAYRGFAGQMAQRAEAATFVIDYPLAPEHSLPAAPEMALKAYFWLTAKGFDRIAIVGDSAGGGLTLVTLARLAADSTFSAQAKPVAGVVFSPWTDLSLSGWSTSDPLVDDPLLSRDMLFEASLAYRGTVDGEDALASPLFGPMMGLPPILIQVATDEILLDDARRYATAAAAAGANIRLEIWEGVHHVFQLDLAHLESSNKALDRVSDFLAGGFRV
jgi:monoterpene epsilon-lactone hydrolase